MLKDIQYPGPEFDQQTKQLRDYWIIGYTLLVAAVFAARQVILYFSVRSESIRVMYPRGCWILIPNGASLLETSRAGGIP